MATPSSRTRTLVAELPQHQRPQMASAVFDALALAQIAIVEKARRHRTDLRRTGYALPRAVVKGVACATPGGEAMNGFTAHCTRTHIRAGRMPLICRLTSPCSETIAAWCDVPGL